MRKIYVAMTAALLVTACGDGQPTANNSIENVTVGNEADATNYQAEVIALPPGQQNGVFLRAVRDAKMDCQEITESERIDPVKGNPAWRIRCGKTPHIISITKDGTANIVSRTDM